MGAIETNQGSPLFAIHRSAVGIVARHIDSGHFPTVDIMLCNESHVDDAQRINRSQSRLLSVVESEIERWKSAFVCSKTHRVITIASSLGSSIHDETTEDVNACSHKVINDYGGKNSRCAKLTFE